MASLVAVEVASCAVIFGKHDWLIAWLRLRMTPKGNLLNLLLMLLFMLLMLILVTCLLARSMLLLPTSLPHTLHLLFCHMLIRVRSPFFVAVGVIPTACGHTLLR